MRPRGQDTHKSSGSMWALQMLTCELSVNNAIYTPNPWGFYINPNDF